MSNFSQQLAQALGLAPSVTAAWVRSENGPADNPLNLGPGGHFSDPLGASVNFLSAGDKAGYYKGILASSRLSPAAQIAAIKASPFEGTHYANGVLDRVAAEYGIRSTPTGQLTPPLRNTPAVTPVTSAAPIASPSPSSSALPLLQLISANQQNAGLPGLSPLLLTLAASTPKAAPTAGPTAAPTLSQMQQTPQVEVQGNVTNRVKQALGLVQEYLGTPYSWGGGGPNGPSKGIAQGANTVGFDCSGLLQYVAAKAGVSIARTTYDQFQEGTPVSKSQLQPGDGVFFHMSSRGPEHVGVYLGGGKFIEAPYTGATVRISNLNDRGDFVGGRRFVA